MHNDFGSKSSVFLQYGVGIVAYFALQRNLMKLFLVLSIFALIQMMLYYSVGGYSNLPDGTVDFSFLASFGNMGFSSIICTKKLIYWH